MSRNDVDGNLTGVAALYRNNARRASWYGGAIQSLAALVTTMLFAGRVVWIAVAIWLLIVALTFRLTVQAITLRARKAHEAGLVAAISPVTTAAVLNTVAWTLPVAFAAMHHDLTLHTQLWAVGAFLMGASALLLPAVPLSTMLLAGALGGVNCFAFLANGDVELAICSLVFAIASAIAAVESARRHTIANAAMAVIGEKDEVVSLLLREFEESEADWLWHIDAARCVTAASPRFAFALGREPYEINGLPFIELLAGGEGDAADPVHQSLLDLFEHLKRRAHFSNLVVQVKVGGRTRWWELSGTRRVSRRDRFMGFHGVGSDVTAARESTEKIAYLARYDTLTALPNRRMLGETLPAALKRARQQRRHCAFLMIDLDRFKAVNDTLGHQVGDQLLARVSERLTDEMGSTAICCRLGGDEFAVVIPDAGDAASVANSSSQLIARLSQPYAVDGHQLFVGASIGSAIGPQDGADSETLMRNADLALYRAKDAGGNVHCHYEPTLHAVAEERRQLEAALRNALPAGEFSLQFQPVVDARSAEIVSLEALLRWNSATLGSVSPAKFVPVAEDTRLVIPIGEWVLRQACLEATRWPDRIRIAVNVSGEQLLDREFPGMVVSALAQSGLAPQRLEIEVTESIFLRDAALARSALEQVMALGCTVALDDFGTGYSSLGYLRELRFSAIKIDRSFVTGAAERNPECMAIIRAVVTMAESLEMSTTAEGVETATELELVRALGCRKVQGFYFGKPMSAEDAGKLFDARLSLIR